MEVEHRILCLGARTSLDANAEIELRALLAGPVNWERLLAEARFHEVVALLLRTLGPLQDSVAIPASWLEPAERYAAATLVRNLSLADELARVLGTFEEAGIEPIPVKGIVLAERVYGGLSLRPAADLDVLVHPRRVESARALLPSIGYVQSDAPDFATAHHPFHDTYYGGKNSGAVCFELHTALWDPHFFGPPDGLWKRAVPAEFRGVRTRFLSPEDALLHLAIHRSQSPLRLRFLCDVAELLRCSGGELAWEEVIDRAEALRARTALGTSLRLARDLLGAPVPAESLERLAVGRLKRRLLERTCGAQALFRSPRPDDLSQRPHVARRALRTFEQDGAPHIGWALARGFARKVEELRYERRLARASAAGRRS
jgi:hypothetical protein